MVHKSVRRCAAPILSIVALILGLVAVAAGSATASVPSRHASKINDRGLFAGLKVTSSTHKSLHLSVSADKSTDANTKPTVTVTAASGHETHSWTFGVAKSAIKIGHGSGHITLSKATSHGFASVKLKFTKASSAKKFSCTRVTKSHVHGTIWLNTKSKGKHAWGTLGSSKHKISVKGGEDDFFNTCGTTPHCASGKSWDVFSLSGRSSFISGGTRGKHGEVNASRNVTLGKYGSRFDLVTAKAAAPNPHGSGGSATMVVKTGHSPAHGKLVLHASGAPTKRHSACLHKGKKTKEKITSYNATVTSHHFGVRADIFGSFKAPKSATFTVTRF